MVEQCPYQGVVDTIIEGLVDSGFSVLSNVFALDKIEYWRALAQKSYEEGEMSSARVGKSRALETGLRQDHIRWLDLDSSEFDCYQAFLESLSGALNRELFLGVSGFEGHFACYPPGGFYRRHRDRFKTQDTRQISVILYLNAPWQASDGGELILYHDQETELTRVVPTGNTLVCFRSEMLHEVLPTFRMRYSLTGWFLRRGSQLDF